MKQIAKPYSLLRIIQDAKNAHSHWADQALAEVSLMMERHYIWSRDLKGHYSIIEQDFMGIATENIRRGQEVIIDPTNGRVWAHAQR